MKKLLILTIAATCAISTNAMAENWYGGTHPSVEIFPLDGTAPAPLYNTDPTPAYNYAPMTTSADEANIDTEPKFLGADWEGRINAGASLQTGNTESDAINLDTTIKAKWNDIHRATLKAEYNRETEDDLKTENNKMVEGQYDYFLHEKWFLNSNLGFEQDEISELDLRTTAGAGLGYQPYESDDLNLQFILGPSYLHEEYEGGSEDDALAAHWSMDYDQKIIDDMFEIFHEHEILVPSDDADAFLFNSKSGIRIPLKKGLVATGEIDFDWDNAPETGVKEDDTTYAAKLGYEW
ncbi:MAG: DUF481 domain-containing protein [Micavibrio sp.]|nr:DUF481 domain-containing protein [Micavibrio sp.]